MNQKRQPHIDATFEVESPETSEQLDALERRLQATRPRSPHLDVETLQQLADGVSADTLAERAPRTLDAAGGKRLIGGRMLTIAGSWSCGALVGALVVFALMSRATAPGQVERVRQTERQAHDSMIDDLPGDDERVLAIAHGSDADRPFTGPGPLRRYESAYGSRGPTLQVGMRLKGGDVWLTTPLERVFVQEVELMRDEPLSLPPRSRATSEARSPVSRRALMQEFLGDSTADVL